MKIQFLFTYLFIHLIFFACQKPKDHKRPNIIVILADDLGYGDLSCYNENPIFKTNHIDKLAAQGIRFTDAHSSSAVCTPTRYSILTGRYSWRTKLKKWVLKPWEAPLIETDRLTLPTLLKKQGYYTTAVGKWHLGWNWPGRDSLAVMKSNGENVDYSSGITGGPLNCGFDYYFGDDVPNYPPYTFIENEKVSAVPTIQKPDSLFGHKGKMASNWKLAQVMPAITEKAVKEIEKASQNKDNPFFLYFALTAPHTPIAPTGQFTNKSGAGLYGDYVMQVDWTVGQILEALERNHLSENTLVIFTSDNGSPARDGTNYSGPTGSVIEKYGHKANGDLRGLKADIWEGGHRVPFIVSWGKEIPNGLTNNNTICSMDLMATIADLTGYHLPENAGEDSENILPLLYGKDHPELKKRALVHHSGAGVFAIRKGDWKLILSNKSGGFSDSKYPQGFGIETAGQLYNLKEDLNEEVNLYHQFPDKVNELSDMLKDIQEKESSVLIE
ncbi:sulfatase family protein [Flexithrix dorotheae]|uniref:sulfatase family protein n=1 Tax=Flexithrix dorotheae TaxID=70993 RepID=UPI000364D56F|nr:arylsulfatase [Flexithrix dorotheae]